MDCVRTAVRQGAKTVKCLYRRDRENMPGSQREVANAEEEGVEFVWLSAPESFTADKHVKEVAVAGMRLGAPDASGRREPEVDPGRKFDVPADMVIKALGFDPEELPHLFGSPDLSVTRWGTLRVDHPNDDDQPARRFCGRRYRPRRQSGRLGHPRRPRCQRADGKVVESESKKRKEGSMTNRKEIS